MKKPRIILILFVLIGLFVSPVFPAEDIPETAYDESETLPYETTPLYSLIVPQGLARAASAELGHEFFIRFTTLVRRNPCFTGKSTYRISGSLTILNQSLRC